MNVLAQILFRICLVVIFPFSSLDKIFNWQGALKQAEGGILPGGPVLLVLAIMVEIGTSVLIVVGVLDRAAAALLAFYCIVTALLYHQFWASGDFFAPGESKGRAHFWDFLKNFGLVGGLGFIMLGAPLASVSSVLWHPFSSTPPYTETVPAK